jgi:hypothetical protein
MDPAYLSGLAVFSGSVVGALTSLISASLTKKHEAHARRASEHKLGCQKLYAQFVEEASKLYVDALVRDQPEPSAMVSLYALISKMRIVSDANVVENAEAVIQTILSTYSYPNKTAVELRDLMIKRELLDPLLTFSEVCRDDLHDLHSGADRPARMPAWRHSNLLCSLTQTALGVVPSENLHELFRLPPDRLLGRPHHRAA